MCLFILEKNNFQKYKWFLSILLQIIYVCIINMISCCVFSSFDVITLHISLTTNYYQWFCLKYFAEKSNCTKYLLYFIYLLFLSSIHWRKKDLSHFPSTSRIAHKYFSSNIHFHPKEQYCGVFYKGTRSFDLQNDFINFSL